MKDRMTIKELQKTYPDYKPTKVAKSKYNNKKTEYNGVLYDSKKEAAYAKRLEYLKHAKELSERVTQVTRQVPYRITVSNKYIATYFADFLVKYGDGRSEVIDVKGLRTPIYRLKKKLVEAIYKVEIIEI